MLVQLARVNSPQFKRPREQPHSHCASQPYSALLYSTPLRVSECIIQRVWCANTLQWSDARRPDPQDTYLHISLSLLSDSTSSAHACDVVMFATHSLTALCRLTPVLTHCVSGCDIFSLAATFLLRPLQEVLASCSLSSTRSLIIGVELVPRPQRASCALDLCAFSATQTSYRSVCQREYIQLLGPCIETTPLPLQPEDLSFHPA